MKYVSATVAALAVLGVPLANRVMYGSVNPWSPPVRFDYCGAHFYRHDDMNAPVEMLGDGAVVSRAQALSISSAADLRRGGGAGMFDQWPVYVPDGFKCPQNPEVDQLDSVIFIGLGPDRYLELTDAD